MPERVSAVGRPLTGSGLVAELRHVASTSDDPALREAACQRLALAARLDAEHVPHVAVASPERWWGLASLSDDAPLVRDGELVRVSPSKVESFDTCSLRWFLESAVGVVEHDRSRAGGRHASCTPSPSWAAAPTRSTRPR